MPLHNYNNNLMHCLISLLTFLFKSRDIIIYHHPLPNCYGGTIKYIEVKNINALDTTSVY